jgi:hypothetical protein
MHMDVEDWGNVGFNMRQAFHAFLYAWVVRVCSDHKIKYT